MISPTKAIRKKCLDCCGQQQLEVKACSALDCPIWEFRLGLHPYTKKNRKNPFLHKKNFVGLENKQASEVIKIIQDHNK
jgi:hypothetical protein